MLPSQFKQFKLQNQYISHYISGTELPYMNACMEFYPKHYWTNVQNCLAYFPNFLMHYLDKICLELWRTTEIAILWDLPDTLKAVENQILPGTHKGCGQAHRVYSTKS